TSALLLKTVGISNLIISAPLISSGKRFTASIAGLIVSSPNGSNPVTKIFIFIPPRMPRYTLIQCEKKRISTVYPPVFNIICDFCLSHYLCSIFADNAQSDLRHYPSYDWQTQKT